MPEPDPTNQPTEHHTKYIVFFTKSWHYIIKKKGNRKTHKENENKAPKKNKKHKNRNVRLKLLNSKNSHRPHEELLVVPRPRPLTVLAHPRSRSRSADGPLGTPTNCACWNPRNVAAAAAAPGACTAPKPARSARGPLGSGRTDGGIDGGT